MRGRVAPWALVGLVAAGAACAGAPAGRAGDRGAPAVRAQPVERPAPTTVASVGTTVATAAPALPPPTSVTAPPPPVAPPSAPLARPPWPATVREVGGAPSGDPSTVAWSLLAVGDVLMDDTEASGRDPFAAVHPPLHGADLAVVNVEMAITDRGVPAAKSFVFRAPPSAAA
ncbi:MAG TPA: CapA family protein, partial [Acidimicrobiales bacterium]|nr:CapA family protein [Acidimicrobiales bacterium]